MDARTWEEWMREDNLKFQDERLESRGWEKGKQGD
jgi:hypothetical protein